MYLDIEVFSSSYILEIESRKLYQIANMLEKRAAHSMLYIQGDIIVVGGIGEECRVLDTCEIYSVEEDSWSYLPKLNYPSMNSSLTSFNNSQIYKIGGKQSEEELCSIIEKLDFESENPEWEIIKLKYNFADKLNI